MGGNPALVLAGPFTDADDHSRVTDNLWPAPDLHVWSTGMRSTVCTNLSGLVSGGYPGHDGDPLALVLIKPPAPVSHYLSQVFQGTG